MIILVAILVVVVIIFGVSSGMQSYATAEQAKAMQEVAKVAEINSWSNLIGMLVVLMVVLVMFLVVAGIVWLWLKRAMLQSAAAGQQGRGARQGAQQPMMEEDPMATLMKIVLMDMLDRRAGGGSTQEQLPAPGEDSTDDLWWLRR